MDEQIGGSQILNSALKNGKAVKEALIGVTAKEKASRYFDAIDNKPIEYFDQFNDEKVVDLLIKANLNLEKMFKSMHTVEDNIDSSILSEEDFYTKNFSLDTDILQKFIDTNEQEVTFVIPETEIKQNNKIIPNIRRKVYLENLDKYFDDENNIIKQYCKIIKKLNKLK